MDDFITHRPSRDNDRTYNFQREGEVLQRLGLFIMGGEVGEDLDSTLFIVGAR